MGKRLTADPYAGSDPGAWSAVLLSGRPSLAGAVLGSSKYLSVPGRRWSKRIRRNQFASSTSERGY